MPTKVTLSSVRIEKVKQFAIVVSFHQVTLAVFLEIFNNLMFVETPVIVMLIRA